LQTCTLHDPAGYRRAEKSAQHHQTADRRNHGRTVR
jgi:hypothetical protein